VRFAAQGLPRLAALAILGAMLGCASAPAPSPPPATAEADLDAVVWQVERPAGTPRAELAFFLVTTKADGEGLSAFDVDGSTLHLGRPPIVTSRDVARVEVAIELDLEHFAVTLHFTPEAARRLGEVTRARLGQRLAVLVDGQLLFAPYIQGVLSDSAMISSRYDRATAVALAERLAP
jgi:hypothetical protein